MQQAMKMIAQELENEIQCYRELLEVVSTERDILLSGEHKRLAETTEIKIGLGSRLARAQESRRLAMQAIVPPQAGREARLGDLTPLLPVDRRGEFKAAVREAGLLAQRLSHMSQANRSFLEEALDTVDNLLAIITGRKQGATYGANGQSRPAQGRSIMAREA